MTPEVCSSPVAKLGTPQAIGWLPASVTELVLGIFGEKPGGSGVAQRIEILVCNTLIVQGPLLPGIYQLLPRLELALEAIGSCGVLAADLKLAGTLE